MQIATFCYISILPTSIGLNPLSCDKSTLMLTRITIPALAWPTERYPTQNTTKFYKIVHLLRS